MKEENSHIKSVAEKDPVGADTLEHISVAHRFNKWMFERIQPFLKGEVLELGSGIGNITRMALEQGLTTTASDYNHEYLEHLRKSLQGHPNLRNILKIDLQAHNLPTEHAALKEKFDSVFLLNVIEHLADENLAINNCSHFLKPGGNMIVLGPSYQNLFCKFDRELGHYRRYTKKSMAEIFPKENFRIIRQEYFNLAGTVEWFLFRKLSGRDRVGKEMNFYDKFVPLFKMMDAITFRSIGLSTITIVEKLK